MVRIRTTIVRRSTFLPLVFVWLLLVTSACSPPAVRSPEPTPVWIQVYASPAWRPLQPVLAECTPDGAALAFLTTPDQADVDLAWGNASREGWSAFELGKETLVVIVHPDNPAGSISDTGFHLVYSGEIRDWDFLGQAPGPLTAWGYPAGDEITTIARSAGLSGSGTRSIAPSPAEMRAAVAADPSAMGLLPARWLDESVRELKIDSLDPDSLRAPLLALTPGEPQGLTRAWLSCLQEKITG